jgi:hypothetical protein
MLNMTLGVELKASRVTASRGLASRLQRLTVNYLTTFGRRLPALRRPEVPYCCLCSLSHVGVRTSGLATHIVCMTAVCYMASGRIRRDASLWFVSVIYRISRIAFASFRIFCQRREDMRFDARRRVSSVVSYFEIYI